MKRLIMFFAIGILTVGLLSACEKPQTVPTPLPSEDTTDESKNTTDTLNKIAQLLGKEDATVIEALGEGSPNYMDGGTEIISREFKITLLKEDVTMSVNYGDDKKVSFSAIELKDKGFDIYNEEMESVLGVPISTENDDNGDEGSGLNSATWHLDQANIILSQAYGVNSIEISPLTK